MCVCALVYEMIKYAENYTTCRKILFENYFSLDSSNNEGVVNEITPDEPCGNCDNCNRAPKTICTEDISEVAEAIIRLCVLLKKVNERVTMTKLTQMLQNRGLGALKSTVERDENMMIPVDRKYGEHVSWESTIFTCCITCFVFRTLSASSTIY